MLKNQTLLVNYLINDTLSTIPTYEQTVDDELKTIQYEVYIGNQLLISKPSSVTELGIKNLQRELPNKIRIASCQTCRFGNFNPYGDHDNEVFCMRDSSLIIKTSFVQFFLLV
ncbi:hypothetical protein C1N55_07610 [Lysinibacillus sp. SGAir0095]|nr:hypothetical protein C1N55_07610 [Lysinibacillus sp. SGAir0095]